MFAFGYWFFFFSCIIIILLFLFVVLVMVTFTSSTSTVASSLSRVASLHSIMECISKSSRNLEESYFWEIEMAGDQQSMCYHGFNKYRTTAIVRLSSGLNVGAIAAAELWACRGACINQRIFLLFAVSRRSSGGLGLFWECIVRSEPGNFRWGLQILSGCPVRTTSCTVSLTGHTGWRRWASSIRNGLASVKNDVGQWNSAVLDAMATYGGNVTVRTTHVRCGSFLQASTDDWLHKWREITESIIAVDNLSCSTRLEDGLSDVWREATEQAFIDEARM